MKRRSALSPILLASLLILHISGCADKQDAEPDDSDTATQSPEKTEPQKASLILPGIGVGEIQLGMTVGEMKDRLGKPDIDATGFSLVYADLGVEVVIIDEKVRMIYCVNGMSNAPEVKACKSQTVEGIGIGSTESDIISAYGEPTNRRGGSLMYKDLGLVFEMSNGQVNILTAREPW